MGRRALAWGLLSLLGALWGCPRVDLDALRFPCQADEDCGPDQRCELALGTCGTRPLEPDGGVAEECLDVLPDDPMVCHGVGPWWCYGGNAAELAAFALAQDAQFVDLEADPCDPTQFSAALVPYQGWQQDAYFRLPLSELSDRVSNNRMPWRLEPLGTSDRASASIMVPTAYGCPFFWLDTEADTAAEAISRARERTSLSFQSIQQYRLNGRTYSSALLQQTATTTIVVRETESDLKAALTRPDQQPLSLELGLDRSRYNAVIGPRAPEEAQKIWLVAQREVELEARLADGNLRVDALATRVVGGERRFDVLLVETSTAGSAARQASQQLAQGLRAVIPTATIGLYLKPRGRAAEIYFGERRLFPARQLHTRLLSFYAMNRVLAKDAGVSLSDPIEVPSSPCDPSTSSGTRSLEETVTDLLATAEPGTATALVQHFGFPALRDYPDHVGISSTNFLEVPGCELESAPRSTTTLSDQAILDELTVSCRPYRDLAGVLRNGLPSAQGDPEGLRARFAALLSAELLRSHLESRGAAIRAASQIHYQIASHATPSPARWDRALVGWIDLPLCRGTSPSTERHFWGVQVQGADNEAVLIEAVRDTAIELARRPLVRALAQDLSCYPPS